MGSENLQVMYPAIFEQLLLFVEFSCKPPQYGKMETKHVANAKYNQVSLCLVSPPHTVFTSLSVFKMLDLLLFCLDHCCFMTHHTHIYHHKKTLISVSVSKYDDLSSAFLKSVLFGCVYGYVFMAF